MDEFQSWTCKVDSSLSPILPAPALPSSSLGTGTKEQLIKSTKKNILSADSKMSASMDLRVLIFCWNTWMVTVVASLIIYPIFVVGVMYFNPNNVFQHSVKHKDLLSGIETEVTVQDRTLINWSVFGMGIPWFGLLIQFIMYTVLKVKPGFYFAVSVIQIVACLALNVAIATMAPFITGIFLATLSWPLYCFGIWISLKIMWEDGIENKCILFTKEELYLLQSTNWISEIFHSNSTVNEIEKCENKYLEMDLKQIKSNAK